VNIYNFLAFKEGHEELKKFDSVAELRKYSMQHHGDKKVYAHVRIYPLDEAKNDGALKALLKRIFR
jgi:hypothetical protein